MPVYIAHRGNVRGPSTEKENCPSYIDEAIALGFDVEVDVRFIKGEWWLGHDGPQYRIDSSFLTQRASRLWVHAKTPETMAAIRSLLPSLNAFEHDRAPYAATTQHILWAYPGQSIDRHTVCVMPETVPWAYSEKDIRLCKGVCTDYPLLYKQRNECHRRVAILLSGRIRRCRADLVPQIDAYLKNNPRDWVDVFVSVNGTADDLSAIRKALPEPYFTALFSEHFVAGLSNEMADRKKQETNVQHALSMYYNNKIAFSLMMEYATHLKLQYSAVLKYRADIVSQYLPERLKSDDLPEGTIFLPPDGDWSGLNDQVALASVFTMRTYCSLYDEVEGRLTNEPDYIIHPETMLMKHAEKHKLHVERLWGFSYELDPKRNDVNED